jgi:glycosyltransferase involved in cell wall biosynthesis
VIVQVLPSIAQYDAISQHVLRIDDELRASNIETAIVADHISPALSSRAISTQDFGEFNDQHVVYHMSIASRLSDKIMDSSARLDLWYHNITPAEYFEQWEPYVSLELRIARYQLSQLAIRADRGVAASRYSEAELKEQGCRHTSVMPVLFDPRQKLSRAPEQTLHAGTQVLSVGRFAPHKRVERVIQVFSMYQQMCDPRAHLHLVGSSASQWYKESLDQLIDKLDLQKSVTFHESIDDQSLSALYHRSDVYLCMSEHEGFCVPLLEAQYCELPIVATNAAAIPETVGNAGIVIDSDRDLMEFVAAIDLVVSRDDVASKLRHNAQKQQGVFDVDAEARRSVEWIMEPVVC